MNEEEAEAKARAFDVLYKAGFRVDPASKCVCFEGKIGGSAFKMRKYALDATFPEVALGTEKTSAEAYDLLVETLSLSIKGGRATFPIDGGTVTVDVPEPGRPQRTRRTRTKSASPSKRSGITSKPMTTSTWPPSTPKRRSSRITWPSSMTAP